MAEVKILLEGFVSGDVGGERTMPTMTLVRDGDLVMVVDPGVVEDQQMIIDALAQEGLEIDDVDVVCITHSHIDHYRNVGMFGGAKILEYWGLWEKNKCDEWNEQFSGGVRVLKTPGHSDDSLTFLIETDEGMVAICGDVFWKENYPEDDPYASDFEKLQESRKMILGIADFIIPGHGPIFKVEK
jgi:glyoxylase-like metal-dependent hydrolase (beta-lactamase superfamily II)